MLSLPGEKIASVSGSLLRGHGIYEALEADRTAARHLVPPVTVLPAATSAAASSLSEADVAPAFAAESLKRRRRDADGDGSDDGPSSARVLVSCTAGVVERVNKLVRVNRVTGLRRYVAEVGDIVVGRVVEVGSKRWKLDIQGHRCATLHLSGVNLAGGAQRMRTYEDSLNMRTVFTEGDLVSAEVQSVTVEGVATLHTRSLTYGKMENGQVVAVPAGLVPRLGKHALTLEACGVDILLGNNGMVWVTRPGGLRLELGQGTSNNGEGGVDGAAEGEEMAEVIERERRRHAETPILHAERRRICNVRNAIETLACASAAISPSSIVAMVSSRERAAQLKSQQALSSSSG